MSNLELAEQEQRYLARLHLVVLDAVAFKFDVPWIARRNVVVNVLLVDLNHMPEVGCL